MFITRQALENAQLEVSLDDNGLVISGMNDMPKEVRRNVEKIAGQLAFTPQEHDELLMNIANVTVWRRLKSITSV